MRINNYNKIIVCENLWGQINTEFKSSGYYMPSSIYDESYYFQYSHSVNAIFVWK